jgi:hypothetical protein
MLKNIMNNDYALIDENNKVINIIVVENPNEDLLNSLRIANNASQILSCEQYGLASINGTFTGEYFLDYEGNRLPPTPEPVDENYFYEYNWELNDWVISFPRPKLIIDKLTGE